MTKFGFAAAALLAGTFAGAGPARAHMAQAAPALATRRRLTRGRRRRSRPRSTAADMGDLGPLRRALPAARGDAAAADPGPAAPARLRRRARRIRHWRGSPAGSDPAPRALALSILTAEPSFAAPIGMRRAGAGRLARRRPRAGDAEGARQSEQQWQTAALLADRPAQSDRGRDRRAEHRCAHRPGRAAADRRHGERAGAGSGVRHRRQPFGPVGRNRAAARRHGDRRRNARRPMASRGRSRCGSASPTGWRSPARSCATCPS